MHFEVAVHLKRFEEAVEWSVKLFVAVWRNTFYSSKIELSAGEEKVEKAEGEVEGVGVGEGEGEIEGKKEMMSVMDRVLVVIGDKEKNLFAFALPLIARFLIEISTEEKEKSKECSVLGSAAARSVLLLCKDYQSRVCVGYGDFCLKKLQVVIISSQLSTLSYHITTVHPIISHHIIVFSTISHHITSYRIILYPIISHPTISHHVISYHIISYHVMSCLILVGTLLIYFNFKS
jgi:hypothetical protein